MQLPVTHCCTGRSHLARACHKRSFDKCRTHASPSPSQQQSATSTPSPAGTQSKPQPSALQAGLSNFKIERVENLDEGVWEGAGIAAVDRGNNDNDNDWGRVALLVGGDMAALLLFAAIGRMSHGESLAVGDLLTTAGPFIAGVLITSPLSGAYGKAAQSGSLAPSAVVALKAWGLGIPAGLLLRILSRGYVPDKAFIIVSLVVNLVLLAGWRCAAAAALPEVKPPAAGAAGRINKQGNPLEFLQLLSGLVKRW